MATPTEIEQNQGEQRLRERMRDGRLLQVTEHIDRIERELSEVQELVMRMREETAEAASIRHTQLARDRTVTSACWPNTPVVVQEDSASL
jgi:hypothetical protein